MFAQVNKEKLLETKISASKHIDIFDAFGKEATINDLL